MDNASHLYTGTHHCQASRAGSGPCMVGGQLQLVMDGPKPRGIQTYIQTEEYGLFMRSKSRHAFGSLLYKWSTTTTYMLNIPNIH